MPSPPGVEAHRAVAGELAQLHPRRSADHGHAVARDLGDDRPDEVLLGGPLGDLRRQPAGVGDADLDPPRAATEIDDLGVADLQPRRRQRLGDGERGVWL